MKTSRGVPGLSIGAAFFLLFAGHLHADDLVLYFDFNAAPTGSVVADQSGWSHDGELHGAAFETSAIGNVCFFDGIDDYIRVPGSSSLALTGSLTMATWFKTPNYDRQRPLLEFNASNAPGIHLWTGVWGYQWHGQGTGANLVDAERNERDYVINTANPTPNQWHHLAVTYDAAGGEARVFIDGALANEKNFGLIVPESDGDLYIGFRPGQPYDRFYGWLDEVRIYTRALSPAEIAGLCGITNAAAPVVGSVKGLLDPATARDQGAQWRLTSGPDTAWHDSGQMAVDLPVGAYTMTFRDIAAWTTPQDEVVEVIQGETAVGAGVYTAIGGGTNTLVLHYTFDDDDGDEVIDLSGYGNNATAYGASPIATACGGLLSFDGIDDYLRVPASPSLTLSNSLSMAVWFKITSYADQHQHPILEWNDTLSHIGVHMWTGVNGLQWFGKGTGANLVDTTGDENEHVISTTNPPPMEWHHLAVTYDRATGNGRVYLDGTLQTEDDIGLFTPRTANDLFIGMRPGQPEDMFQGEMDDVRVYKGALSSAEVFAVYASFTNCARPTGSVTCEILPPEAIAAGARWRLLATPLSAWNESGTVLGHIDEGSYTMEFSPLTGWVAPTAMTVQVVAEQTTSVAAAYTVITSAPPHLVLYYNFNEDPSSLVVHDQSGYGNDGDLLGTVLDGAVCGGVLRLSGTGEYVRVPASPSLNITGSLSLAAWFKTTDYEHQRPILEWNDGLGHIGVHLWTGVWGWQWHGLGTGANLVDRTGNENAYIINAANPVAGQWHHLAVVYDQALGSARLYLDGALASEKLLGQFVPATDADLYLGARPNQPFDWFKGSMDEIRVYDGALTAPQVAELFRSVTNCEPPNASVTCVITPPQARSAGAIWRLTSGDNTNWQTSGSTVADLEAQVNTITFISLPGWTTPVDIPIELVRGANLVITGAYVLQAIDDVPPVLERILPPDGSVGLAHSAAMVVMATDNVAVASVTVNGMAARTDNGHTWNFDLTGIRGSYNAATVVATDQAGNQTTQVVRYAQSDDITLTSMWDGYWRVRNPHGANVAYTWEVNGDSEAGAGIAPANADDYFTTSPGPKTVKLYVDGNLVDVANSNHAVPAPDGLASGQLDSDADGLSNYDEEIAGSDVNDPSSWLALEPEGSDAGNLAKSLSRHTTFDADPLTAAALVFTWQSGLDSMYSIQGSTDLQAWFAIPGYQDMPGTGGAMSFTNSSTAVAPLFLRVGAAKLP